MQKVNYPFWPAMVILCLWAPAAQASDYGDGYMFVMMLGIFGIPIAAGLVGFVLIFMEVRNGTKKSFTWKFYIGLAMLLYFIVNLIIMVLGNI
jgi:hypothetical protein